MIRLATKIYCRVYFAQFFGEVKRKNATDQLYFPKKHFLAEKSFFNSIQNSLDVWKHVLVWMRKYLKQTYVTCIKFCKEFMKHLTWTITLFLNYLIVECSYFYLWHLSIRCVPFPFTSHTALFFCEAITCSDMIILRGISIVGLYL